MARFSVDPRNLPELGRALANAVTDAAAREQLRDDPKQYLVNAGVDESAIKDLNFAVVRDTRSTLFLVVPAEIDEDRRDDPDYLTELGKTVVLGCALVE
ncbi:MAG: hypothetical protein AAGL24_24865 [Pseudomonadota bacterium]